MLWPPIADEESASRAASQASKLVFAWSFFLIGIGLLDLLVVSVTPSGGNKPAGTSVASAFVWYTLGEGLVFVAIGWRVRKMSLGWAIAGLLVCLLGAVAVLPSPFAFVVYAFLVLIFANLIRASRIHKRLAMRTQ
jgi:hypothetical protein